MIKIKVEALKDTFRAKATLSGRCINGDFSKWEEAPTKEQALKKLKTKLTKELSLNDAANYRIQACLYLIDRAV